MRCDLDEYEIECILDKKELNGEDFYYVKWKGWDSSSNTWEPFVNIKHCKELLQEFELKRIKNPITKQIKKKVNSKQKIDNIDKHDKIICKIDNLAEQLNENHGNFMDDQPEKIIKCYQQYEDKPSFRVVWKQRADGSIPESSVQTNQDCRKFCPQLIVDYYEEKLMFYKRIE